MDSQAPAPAGPGDDVPYEQLLTGLRRFLRTDGQRYLDDPNVASIGLGYKVTGGRPTGELSVQFTVEEKRLGPEALADLGTHMVPETVTVAGVRVPTDVLERRSQPALAARPQRVSARGRRLPWRRGGDPGPDVVREA